MYAAYNPIGWFRFLPEGAPTPRADWAFCFTDLGSSLVGEIEPGPPQNKVKLFPRLPALLFGVEVSVYLRTGAGVEKGLCWVEKYSSTTGFLRQHIELKQRFGACVQTWSDTSISWEWSTSPLVSLDMDTMWSGKKSYKCEIDISYHSLNSVGEQVRG